jgi:hypothetical protein
LAAAPAGGRGGHRRHGRRNDAEATAAGHRGAPQFTHIATFDVTDNGSAVAEIVDATRNGRTLIHTDSDNEVIGFVDIADPAAPQADGTLGVGSSSQR